MMQTKLASLLLTHAPLQALVGDRVDWDRLPQGSAQGTVVMYVISSVADYTMGGPSGYVATRVQCDCRAASAAKAREIAEAVADKLSGFHGEFGGFVFHGCFQQGQRTRSDKDGPEEWFTDSRDFTIHWAKA